MIDEFNAITLNDRRLSFKMKRLKHSTLLDSRRVRLRAGNFPMVKVKECTRMNYCHFGGKRGRLR